MLSAKYNNAKIVKYNVISFGVLCIDNEKSMFLLLISAGDK